MSNLKELCNLVIELNGNSNWNLTPDKIEKLARVALRMEVCLKALSVYSDVYYVPEDWDYFGMGQPPTLEQCNKVELSTGSVLAKIEDILKEEL